MFATEDEIDEFLEQTEWLTSAGGNLHTLMDGRHAMVRRRGAGWTRCWNKAWSRETFLSERAAMRELASYHLSLTTTGILETMPPVLPVGFQRKRADGRAAWVFAS